MNDFPTLSIIVPVYNVEQYLPKCIDSVLTQSFSDFELILVDDGSTDGSGRICDDYAQKDSRIKAVHKQNGGQGPARNTGLDIARGRYISFIDSDDYISEDLYEKNIPILLNDETIDILQFPIRFVYEDKEVDFNIPNYEAGKHLYSKKEFFHFWSDNGIETRGYVWQNIYAHELWNGVRFDKIYYEDCAIQNKLLPKTKHVYLSGFGAYKYVQRGGDITF